MEQVRRRDTECKAEIGEVKIYRYTEDEKVGQECNNK